MYTTYLNANSSKNTTNYSWYVKYHEDILLSKKNAEDRRKSEGFPVPVPKDVPQLSVDNMLFSNKNKGTKGTFEWTVDKIHYFDSSAGQKVTIQTLEGWKFVLKGASIKPFSISNNQLLLVSEKSEQIPCVRIDLFRYEGNKIHRIPLLEKRTVSERAYYCASSPDGTLHAVANLEHRRNPQLNLSVVAVEVFEVKNGKVAEEIRRYCQPGVSKVQDVRLVNSVQWSPDGKYLSALFAVEPLMVTWYTKSMQISELDKQQELGTGTTGFEYFSEVPQRVVLNQELDYKFFIRQGEALSGILGFNRDPFRPQTRFRDYYEKQKGGRFKPPEWKHNSSDSLLPATRIYCSGEDDLDEVRQCVVQRDLVNLGNAIIINHPMYKTSGYQQLWDTRKKEEKKAKEKQKKQTTEQKEDDLNFVLTLPPNFALYTHAPIIEKEVFEDHKQKDNNIYDDEVIEAGALKRHVINVIGYAFDSFNQPDQIYFTAKSLEGYPKFKDDFVVRLTKMLDYVFVCAQDLELKTIVLAFVGGGAFIAYFPTSSSMKDFKNSTSAYTKCFQEALRNSIEKVKEKTGKFELALEYAADSKESVSVFDELGDLGIQYLAKIPDAFFTPGAKDKLFVNAWDPHSHAGNEHNADKSLDAFMGRCSAISYLSNAELNPSLADISSYRVVRPTSFSWESVLDHKEKFNLREFKQNIWPCLQDMYGGNVQAKNILEDRKKVERVVFVKDLCGDPVRFLILLLRQGLIDMGEYPAKSFTSVQKAAIESVAKAKKNGHQFTTATFLESWISAELLENAETFLTKLRWTQAYQKVAILITGNLLSTKTTIDEDVTLERLQSRLMVNTTPGDEDYTVCGISAEYLLHLIILYLQAQGRQKNQYIFLTKGIEEEESLETGYISQYFSPPPSRHDVLSMFYKKAIRLPFHFQNGLDVQCQREKDGKHFHSQIEKKFQEFLEQTSFNPDFFSKGLKPKAITSVLESTQKLEEIYTKYKKQKPSLTDLKDKEKTLLNATIQLVLGNLNNNPLVVVRSGAELTESTRGHIDKTDGQIFSMDRRIAREFDPNKHNAHMEDDIDWSLLVLKDGRLSVKTTFKVLLVPTYFKDQGKEGDFSWMIQQPKYAKHFFIYNDNQEQYLNTNSKGAGGGNAVIRPYRYQEPPRAFGIPTGLNGEGYSELSDENKNYIDGAINTIYELCVEYGYTHVHYSADNKSEDKLQIGTAIFAPHKNVKKYITRKLLAKFELDRQASATETPKKQDCAIM